jgi:hypothetical protein
LEVSCRKVGAGIVKRLEQSHAGSARILIAPNGSDDKG